MIDKDKSIQGLLMMASHKYARKTFNMIDCKEIHPKQIPMLLLLKGENGKSQREIASMLGIAPPTVNVTIRRMESSGLVMRRADEKDLRTSRICLTDQGRQLADQLTETTKRSEMAMSQGFTDSELCLFKRFLQQLVDNIDSMDS